MGFGGSTELILSLPELGEIPAGQAETVDAQHGAVEDDEGLPRPASIAWAKRSELRDAVVAELACVHRLPRWGSCRWPTQQCAAMAAIKGRGSGVGHRRWSFTPAQEPPGTSFEPGDGGFSAGQAPAQELLGLLGALEALSRALRKNSARSLSPSRSASWM